MLYELCIAPSLRTTHYALLIIFPGYRLQKVHGFGLVLFIVILTDRLDRTLKMLKVLKCAYNDRCMTSPAGGSAVGGGGCSSGSISL